VFVIVEKGVWNFGGIRKYNENLGSEKGSGTNSAQHPSGHLAIGS
jgi:hypothetical protein